MPKYEASGAKAPSIKTEYVAADGSIRLTTRAATHKAPPQTCHTLIKF
jgi:hypothetical protein